MGILRDFTDRGKYYKFDAGSNPHETITTEVSTICGYASQLKNNQFALLYKADASLYFQMGKEKWCIGDNVKIEYRHLDNGVSCFSVEESGEKRVEYKYESW